MLRCLTKLFNRFTVELEPKFLKNVNKNSSEVEKQKFNTERIELGNQLLKELDNVDITWCSDGCAIISTTSPIGPIKAKIKNHKMKVITDRTQYKHKAFENEEGVHKSLKKSEFI